MSWQKRARIGVAVIGLASAATVYLLLGKRQPPAAPVVAPPRDPQATNETGPGKLWWRQSNGDVAWDVQFESSSSYADGRLKFVKAHFVSPRGSQPLELWSDEAVTKKPVGTGSGSGDVDLTGHVVVQTKSGWHIETNSATYEEKTNLLRMADSVTFAREAMSGTSRGATYDRAKQIMVLLADPHVMVKPDAQGTGALDATAVQMTIDRAARFALLHEQARITRDKEVFTADDATLRLTDDEKSVRAVELRGRASVTPIPGAVNPPPEMHAEEIDLAMRKDGRLLQTGALRRQAMLTLPADAGTNRIEGQSIRFSLAPDGKTVAKLDASDHVTVLLPQTADTGARSITAEKLTSVGDDKAGLKELNFDGSGGIVTFTEAQPAAGGAPASTRTGTSRLLTLKLDGGLGAVTSAVFRRDVKFINGTDVTATADRAEYFEPKAGSTSKLWLYQDGGKSLPRVVNRDLTIEAELVKIDVDSNDVDGSGPLVHTVKKPAPSTAASAPRPGLFASGQRLIGNGATATYRSKAEETTYTSSATVRAKIQQEDGNNRIAADRVVVNTRTNDLTATGHVNSSFLSEAKPTDGRSGGRASSAPQTYAISAATMKYTDASRVAHYEAGPDGPAVIESQAGVTQAQTIDLFLDADGRTVKRMVAVGHVYTRTGVREATGDHLVWVAAVGSQPDTYTLTGKAVYIKEPKQPKPEPGQPDCSLSLYVSVTFSPGGDMSTPPGGPGLIKHGDSACSVEIPGKGKGT